jgi:hypothetical protein
MHMIPMAIAETIRTAPTLSEAIATASKSSSFWQLAGLLIVVRPE